VHRENVGDAEREERRREMRCFHGGRLTGEMLDDPNRSEYIPVVLGGRAIAW
jgi:hypothetical protein